MTVSLVEPDRPPPSPVPVRRYRYSKWRWRVLVTTLDAIGAVLMWLWRRVRARRIVASPRRILVVQLDHLGDAVLSSPLFPALRAAYPEAVIDVLASPSGRHVFESCPDVSTVRTAERNWFERRPGGWSGLAAVWRLGRALRRHRYDLGIDVRGDVLTVFVLALAGIPRRLGWAMGGGGFLLTDIATWVPGRHEVLSRVALLEALGLRCDEPPTVRVHVSDADRLRVARGLGSAWPEPRRTRRASRVAAGAVAGVGRRARLGASGTENDDPDILHAGRFDPDGPPLLAVHLGAGTLAKRWPIQHWQHLIDRFLSRGWRIVVVGGADDVELSRTILPHPDLADWTGRLGVGETTALIERADLFLGVDSGPAHLAAAAGTASVILFSGTNRLEQWRPWSRRTLVLQTEVPCRPCHRKVCPLADHPCMSGLDPDRVFRAAWSWWGRTQSVLELSPQEARHAGA
jgi:heptosyltransferase-2